MKRVLLAAALLLWALPAFATTYYVANNGNDANNGTAKGTPFRTAPTMDCGSGWSGVTIQPDDIIVFKGGDIWKTTVVPSTDCMAWSPTFSGTSGHPVTLTVDQTWYTGGAYTAPIFSGEYLAASCLVLNGNSYITINGIEFRQVTTAVVDTGGLINAFAANYIVMTNLYGHGWRQTGPDSGQEGGFIFRSDTGAGAEALTRSLTDSILENSENTGGYLGGSSGLAAARIGTMTNVTIHDVASAVLFTADWNGGTQYNVSYPSGNQLKGTGGTHPNGVYTNDFGSGLAVVRNSKFRDTDAGSNMILADTGCGEVRVYNNVFYGHMSSQRAIEVDPYHDGGAAGDCGTFRGYNNQFYLEDSGLPAGKSAITVVDRFTSNPNPERLINFYSYNNYCIGSAYAMDDAISTTVVGVISRGTNLPNDNTCQAKATAEGQGFIQANLWAPQNGSALTISAATDLSAYFTTDRNGYTKTAGYWDIGPYQYQGTSYYVATTGNDSNPGTIGSPFLTIEKCIGLTVMTRRDTCYVRTGNYRAAASGGYKINAGLVNTASNWNDLLTLKAYNGEAVSFTAPGFSSNTQVIGFGTLSPYTTPSDIYWKLEGISIRGDGNLDTVRTIRFPIAGILGSHVWLKDVEVSYGIGSGILPASSDWIFENLNVHHNGTDEQDHGLYFDGSRGLVDGGQYHDNSGYGIQQFHSTGCSVAECTDDNTIRNATIYNNATFGSGANLLMATGARNTAYNNVIYGSGAGEEVDIFYRCSACTFYNNTVIPGSGKAGVVLEGSVTGTIIKGNILYTSGGGTPIVDSGTGTVDSNNLKATNPTFIDGTNHDYRLQSTSAARVANGFSGANLYSITGLRTDKGGIARANSAFDAGAYTYDSAPTCTPSKVVFTSQPTGTNIGASLGTISVAIQDSGSNTCTAYSSTITLSKHAATCTAMTLNGTVSGAASSGVFSTSNVNMTGASGNCSLDAASSGLTGATSNTFAITAGSFTLGTSSGTQGQTINIGMTGSGTAWANGTTAATFSGSGITVNSTTCSSTSSCTANITLSSSALAGLRDVTMTTNAEVEIASSAFNVLATPTVGNGGGFRLNARIR